MYASTSGTHNRAKIEQRLKLVAHRLIKEKVEDGTLSLTPEEVERYFVSRIYIRGSGTAEDSIPLEIPDAMLGKCYVDFEIPHQIRLQEFIDAMNQEFGTALAQNNNPNTADVRWSMANTIDIGDKVTPRHSFEVHLDRIVGSQKVAAPDTPPRS